MKNILRDIYLFLFIFCIYFVGRFVIYCIFPSQDAQITWNWLAMCVRFDMLTSAYILLPRSIVINGKIIPINSSDCPNEYKQLHRMYTALAYYRSITNGIFK